MQKLSFISGMACTAVLWGGGYGLISRILMEFVPGANELFDLVVAACVPPVAIAVLSMRFPKSPFRLGLKWGLIAPIAAAAGGLLMILSVN